MSILWYPTPKQSPLLGSLGMGGGIGSNLISGGLTPGSVSATFSSNSDNYSGAARGTATTCNGTSFATFDGRPPTQTQIDDMMSAWMNCKSYAGDGVNPQTYNGGQFFGRNGNSVTFTFTGFQPNQELGIFLYTTSSRTITFSGLISATDNDKSYDYRYFNVNSSGGGTLTAAFNPTGDPPYIYWSGPRYDDPGY
jgi:hypothetical protein